MFTTLTNWLRPKIEKPTRRVRRLAAIEQLEERAVMNATYFQLNSTPTGIFSNDWSNTGLLAVNNDWSAVPSIVGYNGAGLTNTHGTAPGSITSGTTGAAVVSVDQSNPNTFAPGGIAEFELSDPVVALSGSSSAPAPHLLLHMDTRGTGNVLVRFNVRDLVGSNTPDSVTSVALQYRVGSPTGDFTNVPFETVTATGDITIAGGTQSTPVTATLPAAANDQPFVQIRIITTNARDTSGADGPDEWIGIDDIVVDGNLPPVITIDTTTLDYYEQLDPGNPSVVAIDPVMGLSDADSPDFNGGFLQITYAQVPTADDKIYVNNQGTGLNQISVSGNNIRFTTGAGTQTIGTMNAGGGVGLTPLTITFTSPAADQNAIRALLRSLRYQNVSDDPLGGIRTVQFVINDGDGRSSAMVTRDINVIPVNDEPVLTNLGGPLTIAENADPIILSPSITIADPDSHDYDGGTLTVFLDFALATSFDQLTIEDQGQGAGLVGLIGNQVTFGGTVIGTFTGGAGGTPLVITFNAASAPTPATIQSVARAIRFQNTSDNPPSGFRKINFTAFDNDADAKNTGVSITRNVTVQVQPENDAPEIANTTTGIAYTENGNPLPFDAGITLNDPDSLDFNSGTIVAEYVSGATAGDRLTIRNEGTGIGQVSVAGNEVRYNFGSGPVPVGTITSSGQGSTKLQVTFNPAADSAAVEAVLRNVAYFNATDDPVTTNRVVRIQVGDGDGDFSSFLSWTISVTAVNDGPMIANVPPAFTYEAGFPAAVFAPAATVTDPDTQNFNTGTFTATISQNAKAGDALAIRNQGSGSGRIGLIGTTVTYSGIPIGSFSGGTGGAPLVVSLSGNVSQPALEALAKSITFRTPNGVGVGGIRTIELTATDFSGGTISNVAVQDLTVTSNAGPNDDFYETDEDVPNSAGVFTVSAANGVLNNDPSPAQLVANTTLVRAPLSSQGTVSLQANGGFTFTPAANANGNVTFEYEWINTTTNATGIAEVTIVVNAVNDAPTATFTPNAITVNEDFGSFSKLGFAVFGPGGGTDEAAQTLTRQISNNNTGLFSTQPAIDVNGRLTFATAPDANGTAIVSVTVTDSGGSFNNVFDDDSQTYTFTITVNAVNDVPSFQLAGTSVSVIEDFGTKVVPNFALNFRPGPGTATDEATQTATYILTPLGIMGGLTFSTAPTIDENGTLTFAAAQDSNGSAQFLVQVQDSGGLELSASRNFTITVGADNDPPTLTNDSVSVAWNSDANPIAVLTNDSALPDAGETISVTLVSQPANGTALVESGGTGVTYQPAQGFVGTDTFTYTVTDSGGGFATATVTVNVIRYQTQPIDVVAVAAGPGNGSKVRLYNAKTGAFVGGFSAYAPEFQGGVSVAMGDVNGDGVADIVVGAGPGGGPHIQVIDGTRVGLLQGVDQIAPPSAMLGNFFGYDFSYRGGVSVAVGDVNGDGKADIILGTGPGGGAHVRVINGGKLDQMGEDWQPLPSALLANFFAYDPSFRGGVGVATGDVNGDGFFDVLAAAGPGGASHVKAFSGRRLVQVGPNGSGVLLASFYAYDPNFRGGAVVSAGDFNNDGFDDFIVGAGPGGGPHVKVFSPFNLATPIASFYAFEQAVTGGISVGYRMRSGGLPPVLVAGSGSGAASRVNTFAAPSFTPIASAAVFDPDFIGGVDVG